MGKISNLQNFQGICLNNELNSEQIQILTSFGISKAKRNGGKLFLFEWITEKRS